MMFKGLVKSLDEFNTFLQHRGVEEYDEQCCIYRTDLMKLMDSVQGTVDHCYTVEVKRYKQLVMTVQEKRQAKEEEERNKLARRVSGSCLITEDNCEVPNSYLSPPSPTEALKFEVVRSLGRRRRRRRSIPTLANDTPVLPDKKLQNLSKVQLLKEIEVTPVLPDKKLQNLSKVQLLTEIEVTPGSPECVFSYEMIFGPYLDETVTEVHIQDPYIIEYHHMCNLVHFLGLLIQSRAKLKQIILKTKPQKESRGTERSKQEERSRVPKVNQQQSQNERLTQMKTALWLEHHINLRIDYVDYIHDRWVKFNNGYLFDMTRGLDFYDKSEKVHIGKEFFYYARKCKECKISIKFNKT